MIDEKRKSGDASGKVPARPAWEPMSLTRIGKFADVLRGATGPRGDGGARRP